MASEKKLPEHVQIIHSLMLRSKKNREVLIPTVLLTGIVSLFLGVSITLKAGIGSEFNAEAITTGSWVSSWLLAAVSVLLLTVFFAGKQAKRENHPVNTPQLRHVFRSIAPALVLGFASGTALCFHDFSYLPVTASLWIACYGVALHAIRLYTTKSARFLGIVMLAIGLSGLFVSLKTQGMIHPLHLANYFMALSFGMFHLVVASGSILFAKATR